MAYQTKELNLVAQSVGDRGGSIWTYQNLDGDTAATILAANFISDALDKGVEVNDVVIVCALDTGAAATYAVTTVAATGADLT